MRDVATGVEGVITGRYEFINSCIRYTLEFAAGGEPKSHTTDEDLLELVEARAVVPPRVKELEALAEQAKAVEPHEREPRRTGGPSTAPSPRSALPR